MSDEGIRLYNLLKELFLLLDDGDRRLFDAYALSEARFYALYHLGTQPGISSSQLSELMFCDKSNVSRLLKGMEAEGWVLREPHESDGRAQRLYLTPAGKALYNRVSQAHLNYNRERLDRCLQQAEQGELLELLTTLRNGLLMQLHSEPATSILI